MSNMSYCRFQNTLKDLRDCRDRLSELFDYESGLQSLSKEEHRAARHLIGMCREIADDFEDSIGEPK